MHLTKYDTNQDRRNFMQYNVVKEEINFYVVQYKSERIENEEEKIKVDDRKDFSFFYLCLVEGEKVKG